MYEHIYISRSDHKVDWEGVVPLAVIFFGERSCEGISQQRHPAGTRGTFRSEFGKEIL